MNPNTAPTLATFLDGLVADARADLGLPQLPPPTPSLEDVLGAIRSRARTELADDAGEIDRGFITGVHKWETAGLAERLAEMSEPMRESMIRIMTIADDPQRSWQLDLSPAFQAYIERCEGDDPEPLTVSGIGLGEYPNSIPETVGSTPVEPIRSNYPDMACLAFGAKQRISYTSDGRRVVTYLDCDECAGCLAWRRYENAKRFAHVCTKTATVVEVSQLATVDAARAVAGRLARVGPGTRATTLQRGDDYLWTAFMAWPTPVEHGPIVDAMERWEILGTIVDRPVTPAEFASRCPLEKTADSTTETRANGQPRRRRLVRFHKWADYSILDPTYRLSDGEVTDTPIDDFGCKDTPLTVEETRRSKLPIAHQQYLYAREWLPVGSRLNIGLWDDLVDALDAGDIPAGREVVLTLKPSYPGPTRLLRDAAGWLIMGADPYTWREGWRPVLESVGIDCPQPTCCQCGRKVPQQSDDGVCVRCKLEV